MDDETNAPWGWRVRLGVHLRVLGFLGWTRIGLAVLGLAAMTLGAIIAWRAEESLPLLAAGAFFLLAAAVLGGGWRHVQIAVGSVSASLARDIDEGLEAVENSPDEDLRRELAELRERLQTFSEQADAQARRAKVAVSANARRLVADLMRIRHSEGATASHSFADGRVHLLLKWPMATSSEVTCSVTRPAGIATSTSASALSAPSPVASFHAIYPDRFLGSSPLLPGEYEVVWAAPRPLSGLAGALSPQRPIAVDAFTIE